MNIRSQGPY